MTAILNKCWQFYVFLFEDLPDQRLRSWPFIAKPFQVLGLLALYLMFVTKWGPNWMKNRKPFQLKKVLILYNSFQIAICSYIFVRGIEYAWGWDYKWICEPVDFSNSFESLRIAKLTYIYFLTKLLDLLDTVFFVLRKKNKQVTFLHIYHHGGMFLLLGATATYLPGGHGTLIGVINAFVHTLMYSYYLLTVVNPALKSVLRYKKFITQIQILQFFITAVHTGTLLYPETCGYPRWVAGILLPQNLFLTALFTDFYIKTYVRKPKETLENIQDPNKNKDGLEDYNKTLYGKHKHEDKIVYNLVQNNKADLNQNKGIYKID